ncbi:hypothetical protein [Streptomyces iconiensis]|uniref:Uncharacterized protein n=1 Tax=Streptomyces iconiensis TaxID=1384038 RepID=A0ABT7A2C0_9ACTN|nr:hypothetical protein [Streptomyces iconiensis]MDJ1135464.1 hypothetical protein [Streptomyces iconiensis]
MANVIDPERHRDLLQFQQAVFDADAELTAYTGEDAAPLREQVRQAAAARDEALRASGLVNEHGWFTADQDLKRATRAAVAMG